MKPSCLSRQARRWLPGLGRRIGERGQGTRPHQLENGLDVPGRRLALPRSADVLAYEVVEPLRALPEPAMPAEVDGLRRHDELRGDDALAQRHHLADATPGERRHRDAVGETPIARGAG